MFRKTLLTAKKFPANHALSTNFDNLFPMGAVPITVVSTFNPPIEFRICMKL